MKLNCPNIAFRCFDDITSKVSMPHNLNNTTVICLGCDNVEDKIIDKYAEILLKAGCRSFVFYAMTENPKIKNVGVEFMGIGRNNL